VVKEVKKREMKEPLIRGDRGELNYKMY